MDHGYYVSRIGNMENQLYVDGGVVGRNPSPIGGVYAYRIIQAGKVVSEAGYFIDCEKSGVPSYTNNVTEMMALVKGLQQLPVDWNGTVFSDSMITLGRAFLSWKWKGVPLWLRNSFETQAKRLINWEILGHTLLAGHPTKSQLACGIGRHDLPVSEHNVWCDNACNEAKPRVLGAITVTEEITLG